MLDGYIRAKDIEILLSDNDNVNGFINKRLFIQKLHKLKESRKPVQKHVRGKINYIDEIINNIDKNKKYYSFEFGIGTFIKVSDLHLVLEVSKKTIYNWINAGYIKKRRIYDIKELIGNLKLIQSAF
jgi:hypothetical protein